MFLALGIAMGCGACTPLSTPVQRKQLADGLAEKRQWQGIRLDVGRFQLMAYMPQVLAPTASLVIYIEGDGLAWITSSQISRDPTPSDPVALRLALAQPDGSAAYLARPCQYVDAHADSCNSRYWTDARFAAEVVAATDAAIDLIEQRFAARSLTLVGYSGGGAVAVLVAARRRDVTRLITVAGNLDTTAWVGLHHLVPLTGSENPADNVSTLRGIAQTHLVGERDANVTPDLVGAFAALFPLNERPRVTVVPGFDHHCCWADQWPMLWHNIDGRGQ
jgi:dienelactone hydrolase